MIGTVKAEEQVADCYRQYATYVNGSRQLPSSTDGLKIVQRRILLTLLHLGNYGSLHASSSVVGQCIQRYHPHGSSSIYSAAVNMVNEFTPVLKGKGNFGYKGLVETNAAAERYTKLGLSDLGIEYFSRLNKFADTTENENDYLESSYIPTIIPYCFLGGAEGIGVGCRTHIPPIDLASLKLFIKNYLTKGRSDTVLKPISTGGGNLEISDSELKSFNEVGRCSVTVSASIEWVSRDNQMVLYVTYIPNGVVATKIKSALSSEISDGLVFIKDESDSDVKLVIGRTKKIRRITDEELEERVRKVFTKKLTYACIFSDNGAARLMSPRDVMINSIKYCLKCYERQLHHSIEKVSDDILFEKIKSQLCQMMIDNVSQEDIISKLELTTSQYSKFTSKSISTLKSKPKDIDHLNQTLSELLSSRDNKELSFYNSYVR